MSSTSPVQTNSRPLRMTRSDRDSGARAITAVMGDHLEGSLSSVSVYASFKEKTVILAHTAETRLPQFPDIPTFKELGIDVVRYHWRGMFVKRGTPHRC